jgi:hypothetical protein
LNSTAAKKISTAHSYPHDVLISFSTVPSYLLRSSPSLSIYTTPGPLLSLSISIGDCSGDHPVLRLRSSRAPPRRSLRRPPRAMRCRGSAPTTTLRPGDRNDKEEALRWAALERLATHPAHRRGLPPGLLPRVLAQPPISRAHRPRLLPRLGARRRAHHWRMGTVTLLASRGGVTPPPPSMPS